jgi:hypothetical protein
MFMGWSKKKHSIEECNKIAESKGGECLSKEYVENKQLLLWRCSCKYEWNASFFSINTMNSWCPKCAAIENGKKSRCSIEECKEYAKLKGGECLTKEYKNSTEKMKWKCGKCNNIWETSWGSINENHWCPKCAGVQRFTIDYCKEKAKELGLEYIPNIYVNADNKVPIKCVCGNIWHTSFNDIIRGHLCHECGKKRSKNTCLERYGVEYPMQDLVIGLRSSKGANNRYTKYHWKTGDKLICQGSYERDVVDYLNQEQINYKWQPRSFKTPLNSFYRPDFYDEDRDVWVEIKGWMREDAKVKWLWFKTLYPNAELWDDRKLKDMKIK